MTVISGGVPKIKVRDKSLTERPVQKRTAQLEVW